MKKIYSLFILLFVMNISFAQVEGSWKISPTDQALAVGPTMGDFSWWSSDVSTATTRDCLYDDEFVFNADGSFQNIQGTSTWLEAWQGTDPEACGALVAPHDGSNAATWVDNGDGTLTITGAGAHLGLPKVHNGGELTNPSDAPVSITYPFVISGTTMTVDIDFGGTGFWHFVFEKMATNVDKVVQDMFSFYPNPASTQIQINSDLQLDEVIIRDITGRIVMTQSNPSQNERIDVSNLATGLYILEAHKDNKISVQKLSIN